LPRVRPHQLGKAMQVGVRGKDLTLSRSGQRHIDALCLRKFNQGDARRPGGDKTSHSGRSPSQLSLSLMGGKCSFDDLVGAGEDRGRNG
jgi:hypothetical protein